MYNIKNYRDALIFISLLWISCAAAYDRNAKPIDIGSDRQLFIDERFIERSNNVKLTVNPPQKAGIALKADTPWEQGCLAGSAVIQSKEKVQLYYCGWDWPGPGQYGKIRIGYAESTDGINWVKPSLKQAEYNGNRDNNLFATYDSNAMAGLQDGGNVFIDYKAPPQQRYKMLAFIHTWKDLDKGGLYLHYSADGINWKLNPERLFPFMPDGINQIIYNDETGKYHAYFRQWFPRSAGTIFNSMIKPMRTVGMTILDDPMKPWPYNKEIPPFHLWGTEYLPAPSAEFPIALGYDSKDPPETDLYTGSVEKYEHARGIWLAFPAMFRHWPDDGLKFLNAGLLDIQLAVSRDGIHWKRYRQPYIRMGIGGSIENTSKQVYMALGSARFGNEIYQYYNSWSVMHAEYDSPQAPGWGKFYRAVQRLDGYVSVDAPAEGGDLTTPPLKYAGTKLALNVDTSALGDVTVEILDQNDIPFAGFSAADCELIYANSIDHIVKWKNKNTLKELEGKIIKLKFIMHNAKLYSFEFKP